MKTLIFGAGWLGTRLSKDLPDSYLTSADISVYDEVYEALDKYKPDAVINAAGKTGRPNIDWCEQYKDSTYRSNVIGALSLARACHDTNTYMLHIGSGCILYGTPIHQNIGWRENDFANPKSFYSKTKYAADLVLSSLPNVGIARIRMPIDVSPNHRNLITKLAGYKQVIDVENSVTIVEDLIKVIALLLEKKATGVFHAVNPGSISHRDLMNMYKEYVDPKHEYELIDENELVERGLAKATRSSCILADTRLGPLGITMRPTIAALVEVMKQYGQRYKKSVEEIK